MKNRAYPFGLLLAVILSVSFFSQISAQDKSTPLPPIITNPDDLPELTRTMHKNLLIAAHQGDLEELRNLFESNELAPVLDNKHISNPIEHWKNISIDGTARDIMADLVQVFSRPPIKTKDGDYIWPFFAGMPLDKLSLSQQIDLFRLVGPQKASAMLKNNHYSHYEAKIGKDGTWHSFKKINTP